ncbi:MAG: hypothetical protein ACRDBY_05075 [Cetobacterium sp.]
MTYLQYLSLTMGLRWLIGYIKSSISARKVKEQCNMKSVETKYIMTDNFLLLFMNYVSYKLLCYGLPSLVELIKKTLEV